MSSRYLSPVPRGLPERLVVHQRGHDLEEVVLLERAFEGEQLVVEDRAAGRPEGGAGCGRDGNRNSSRRLPTNAVIAPHRFGQAVEVGLEVLRA